jgi:hypothetical protein
MGKFEDDLFQTVDDILLLLGHKPSVQQNLSHDLNVINTEQTGTIVKERSAVKVRVPITSKKGARLVKSPSELSTLLDKM